jgi:hypothetical protein
MRPGFKTLDPFCTGSPVKKTRKKVHASRGLPVFTLATAAIAKQFAAATKARMFRIWCEPR